MFQVVYIREKVTKAVDSDITSQNLTGEFRVNKFIPIGFMASMWIKMKIYLKKKSKKTNKQTKLETCKVTKIHLIHINVYFSPIKKLFKYINI